MKKSFLIGLLFFVLVSCEKNNTEKAPIVGIWVETTHKTDTLVFDDLNTMFNLNRGTEIRNGYLLPKYSSGSYVYELKKDSVSLRWLLSSSAYGNNYFFKIEIENDQLKFGNFFEDSINKNATLIFSRIN